MTGLSNFDRELVDLRAEQERNSGINSVRRELNTQGESHCIDCDEEISAQRRAALPSAKRCVDCQQRSER